MTLTELKVRVAQKLRILANGATIDSNDDALIEDKYLEVYDELHNQGLVNWESGTSATIPTTHANHVITIIASRSADDFELPEDRIGRLMIEEQQAMGRLREIEHQAYIPDHQPANSGGR